VSASRSRGSDRLVTTARETTPAERAAASRVVLKNARNREDLRLLLDALGLNSQPKTEES